jgi:hypothetical protein
MACAVALVLLAACASVPYSGPIDFKGAGTGYSLQTLAEGDLEGEHLWALNSVLLDLYETRTLRGPEKAEFEALAARVYANVGRAFAASLREATAAGLNPKVPLAATFSPQHHHLLQTVDAPHEAAFKPPAEISRQYDEYLARRPNEAEVSPAADARLVRILLRQTFLLRSWIIERINPALGVSYRAVWPSIAPVVGSAPGSSGGVATAISHVHVMKSAAQARQRQFDDVARVFLQIRPRFVSAAEKSRTMGQAPSGEAEAALGELDRALAAGTVVFNTAVARLRVLETETNRLESAVRGN